MKSSLPSKPENGLETNEQSPSLNCNKEAVTGLQHFRASCLPRLQGLEGQFSPLATWFHHILTPGDERMCRADIQSTKERGCEQEISVKHFWV